MRRLLKSSPGRGSRRSACLGMVVPSLDRDGHGEEEEEEGDADAEAEAAPGALLALLLRDDGLGHSSAGWPETSALIPISTSLFEQYSTERRPEAG